MKKALHLNKRNMLHIPTSAHFRGLAGGGLYANEGRGLAGSLLPPRDCRQSPAKFCYPEATPPYRNRHLTFDQSQIELRSAEAMPPTVTATMGAVLRIAILRAITTLFVW